MANQNPGKWLILQERQGGYWPLGPAAANVIEVLADGMEVVLGDNYREMLVAFLRRHQYYCTLRETYFSLGRKMLDRIEANPDYLTQVKEKFVAMMPEFEATFEKFALPLGAKTNAELWRYYEEYYEAYRKIYPFGEMLPYSIRDSLSDKLEEYLKALLKEKGAGAEKKFGEYYSLLSTPKEKSFATREETGLLRILAEIQGDVAFRDKLVRAPKEEALDVLKKSRFGDALAEHAAAFSWVPFDYGLETWDERHFAAALHDLAKQGFDAKKRLQDIEDYYANIEQKQLKLFSELGVGERERKLFRVAQDCAFMIDFKKEFFTKSHFLLQRLLDEIALRLGFSRTAVRYMLPPEVKTALLSKTLPGDFTNKRFEAREFNCIYCVAGKRRTLYEGGEVERVLEREGFSVRKDASVVEVKGLCACAGTAIGRAKIITSAAELDKLEPGDVLVTYQTTPDFVRAMKRAAAIVTNEGGITCHAAIVSRELGIPCVIGTRIATKVFRDGDVLQVKASHGIVRKVSASASTLETREETKIGKKLTPKNMPNNIPKFEWVKYDERNDTSIFPIIFFQSGAGEGPMKRALGTSLTALMQSLEGRVWTWFEIEGDLLRVGKQLVKKIELEPSFIDETIKETYRLARILLEHTQRVFDTDLAKKSNDELADYYADYCTKLEEMRGPAWIAPALDASEYFSNHLKQILLGYLKRAGKEKESALPKYFVALTAPSKQTLMAQQDKALLKIAAASSADAEQKAFFAENDLDAVIDELLNRFPELKKKFEAHAREFEWLPCTYEGEPWNLAYFVSVAQGFVRAGTAESELNKILEKERRAEEEKKRIYAELKMTASDKRWFEVAQELIFFKVDRKDVFFKSYYQMRPLLREIAERLKLSVGEVRMMTPDEVNEFVRKGEVTLEYKQILEERKKFCVLVSIDDETRVLVGGEARKYLSENVVKEEVKKDEKELKGSCANTGHARGIARLIFSPTDMPKMKQGEILVAPATNPDVVPAMKKAAAIVTNTGGITCHAAIVSRELGIPCVVGTKRATDVIRDGDEVEVDADKGIVKILRHANSHKGD